MKYPKKITSMYCPNCGKKDITIVRDCYLHIHIEVDGVKLKEEHAKEEYECNHCETVFYL